MDSFMPRIGGKKLLRKTICEAFPKAELFNRYVEVFGGMAWVLLYKDRHAELEVYNDADGELINLMKCVKYHITELVRELQGFLNSREMFEDCLTQLTYKGYTDIQRAARYFIRMRISFGSNGREFCCKNINIKSAIERMKAVRERIYNSGVVIEHKDFENLIKVYDREKAFFYCDPPYYKAEKYYDAVFTLADHERLKDCLSKVKGLFLLSYNDCPEVRKLYEGYNIREVERGNNLSRGKYRELIITNY